MPIVAIIALALVLGGGVVALIVAPRRPDRSTRGPLVLDASQQLVPVSATRPVHYLVWKDVQLAALQFRVTVDGTASFPDQPSAYVQCVPSAMEGASWCIQVRKDADEWSNVRYTAEVWAVQPGRSDELRYTAKSQLITDQVYLKAIALTFGDALAWRRRVT